jgi:hypothetical protein
MSNWWPHHIKYKEQLDFYHSYIGNKCKYWCFFSRIHQQWLSYEEAIKPQTLKWKHLIKTMYDENGRVCVICWEYKTRNNYHKSMTGFMNKVSLCKDCRKQQKLEYRIRTNYKKDHEYKKRRRTLEIWTIIWFHKEVYIDWIPREDIYEVIKYEYKKWYMIKSKRNWLFKRIDLWDNGDRPKFYIINV